MFSKQKHHTHTATCPLPARGIVYPLLLQTSYECSCVIIFLTLKLNFFTLPLLGLALAVVIEPFFFSQKWRLKASVHDATLLATGCSNRLTLTNWMPFRVDEGFKDFCSWNNSDAATRCLELNQAIFFLKYGQLYVFIWISTEWYIGYLFHLAVTLDGAWSLVVIMGETFPK